VLQEVSTPGDAAKPLMSLNAFAKRHGVSHQSMMRAVARGRLSASLRTGKDGKPKVADVELADREWRDNADHSKAPAYVKEGRDPSQGGRPAAGAPPSALSLASTREKEARAALAELELARKAGELVRAADVEAAWTDQCAQLQTALLSITAQMKMLHPDTPHAWLASLQERITIALELLATPAKVAS
jgi:phage terminase Nu1 subunit (DNA packaging protein)